MLCRLITDFILHTEKRKHVDWNVEDGYSSNTEAETYPHRVLGPGAKAGLDLLLSGIVNDFDNLCRGPVQGFKVKYLEELYTYVIIIECIRYCCCSDTFKYTR